MASETQAIGSQDTGDDPAPGPVLLDGWVVPDLDFPTFRILLLAKVIDRLTLRRLSDAGELTYAEWRVLSRLATSPDGMTVGRIADLAWVDRAEVSRAASALERRGLIGRRANARDRRKPILTITQAGLSQYRPLIDERQRFHASLVADLGMEERAMLDALLAKVAQRLAEVTDAPATIAVDKPTPVSDH